jgi:hypothetical protein
METPMTQPLTVDRIEAARLLGVGHSVMDQLLRSGDVRSCKIGLSA